MTIEISLDCSYIQASIAFVSANNLCYSYINKTKILIKYHSASHAQQNAILHIIIRYEVRPNKLTKHPQTGLVGSLGFCHTWQIMYRNLQKNLMFPRNKITKSNFCIRNRYPNLSAREVITIPCTVCKKFTK